MAICKTIMAETLKFLQTTAMFSSKCPIQTHFLNWMTRLVLLSLLFLSGLNCVSLVILSFRWQFCIGRYWQKEQPNVHAPGKKGLYTQKCCKLSSLYPPCHLLYSCVFFCFYSLSILLFLSCQIVILNWYWTCVTIIEIDLKIYIKLYYHWLAQKSLD